MQVCRVYLGAGLIKHSHVATEMLFTAQGKNNKQGWEENGSLCMCSAYGLVKAGPLNSLWSVGETLHHTSHPLQDKQEIRHPYLLALVVRKDTMHVRVRPSPSEAKFPFSPPSFACSVVRVGCIFKEKVLAFKLNRQHEVRERLGYKKEVEQGSVAKRTVEFDQETSLLCSNLPSSWSLPASNPFLCTG